MTEAQKKLYTETKERLRKLGKENPADVIVALAEELEQERVQVEVLSRENDDLEYKLESITADWERLKKETKQLAEELKKAREAKG